MKREKYKSRFCSLASLIMGVGIVMCAGASMSSAQSVVASLIDEGTSIPLQVQVQSGASTRAKVTSSQTGCLEPTQPCPTGKKAKINCTQATGPSDVCTAYFPGGTQVTLKASPGDYVFAGWTYSGPPYGENYNFSLNKSIKVRVFGPSATATFVPKGTMYTLVVQPSSMGGTPNTARIVSSPAGIECYGDATGVCSHQFLAGSYVTLTAAGNTGTQLMGWTLGWPFFTDICNVPGPCKVPMSAYLWD
jgi:hypothetical protein